MKRFHTPTLAVLIGLSGLGCATAPPAVVENPAQPVADTSCRNVTSLTGKVQSMCGTPAEWAEFDSRMAQLGQGFNCKPVKGSQPLCLFARQWENMARTNALRAGTLSSFGDEARAGAMAINNNEYNTVRQDMIDSANGLPNPILSP